ncbi:uncharacterized protein BJ212DRAFT_1482913 [Suillus subaureus]|uniref:Uncharacterized protein n=1 Tax=Suillus subaureus TaxID=48587 RepID=A0A9P7E6P1_9AGAM|nr:uncharacterized protein BJ212DRAFT_1482913 [Suillus subaureus]KAG1812852.1 hypothetical protein BJ212DRAFT_1482913 [Suillus subaureus]
MSQYIVHDPNILSKNVPQHKDLVQEQISGERHYEDTLVEYTPTKLHSHIKATNHDAGLVKEASVHQAKLLNDKLGQPPPLQQHSVPLQLPIQDIFYEAPLINSSNNAPADAHKPPQPNLFTKPSFHLLDEYNFSSMVLGSCGDVSEGLAGPSISLPTLSAVPHTYITPPTSVGPAGWDMGHPYTDDFTMDSTSNFAMDDAADVVPTVKGQRLQMLDAILQEGFLDLEHMIQDLSLKTAIPAHQIFTL